MPLFGTTNQMAFRFHSVVLINQSFIFDFLVAAIMLNSNEETGHDLPETFSWFIQ